MVYLEELIVFGLVLERGICECCCEILWGNWLINSGLTGFCKFGVSVLIAEGKFRDDAFGDCHFEVVVGLVDCDDSLMVIGG